MRGEEGDRTAVAGIYRGNAAGLHWSTSSVRLGGCLGVEAMNTYCVIAVDRGGYEKVLHIRAVSVGAAWRCAVEMGMIRLVSVLKA